MQLHLDATPHMKSDLWWFLAQSSAHARWYLYSSACLIGNALASVLTPLAMMWIIDAIIPARDLHRLILAASLLFLASGSSFILGRIGGYCLFHVSQQLTLTLRMNLLQHHNSLSADYHETASVGQNMFLMSELLEQLGTTSMSLFAVCIKTGILFVGGLILMFQLNVHLTLLILPLLPLFAIAIRHFGGNLQGTSQLVQKETANADTFLQDHLSSIVEVQLLGGGRIQARKAFHVWSQKCRAEYEQKKAEFIFVISSTLIIVAATVGVFFYGGLEVIRGSLTIGGLVAFYALVERLFEPLHGTIEVGSQFQQSIASIKLIRRFLNRVPAVREGKHPMPLPEIAKGIGICLDNISFGYHTTRTVIRNCTITFAEHSKIALVGPSGSGKSTLAKLMTRMYDVNSGKILIGNTDIRNLRLSDLRAIVSYVPQRAALFDTSMEENVRLGNPWATHREVEAAAELAELTPVIKKLRKGWAEPLKPRGSGLSGGEKQRVAIARALLRRPQVLILDESTSELDLDIEKRLFANINRFLGRLTLVLITHRLNSIMWVDNIIVLNHGSLQGVGGHQELYLTNPLYRALLQENVDTVASDHHVLGRSRETMEPTSRINPRPGPLPNSEL